MSPTERLVRPRLHGGALAWMSAIQFFILQVIVAMKWTIPYSLSSRFISDLGNTACGSYPGPSSPIVCSPWHAAMNASFVVVGVTMALGAMLTRGFFRNGWTRTLAVILFTLAGVGVLMVGVYPENENITNHSIGAGVNFIAGNVALILFGLALPSTARSRSVLATLSIGAGIGGLVSTVLFVSRRDLGLGVGGIERFAAYTTTVWQIAAGWVIRRETR